MADQTDNLQLLDASSPFGLRSLKSDDNLILNPTVEFKSDVVIDANLTVTGNMTAVETEHMIVEDNHVYLNAGYTSDAAQTAGLVANYDPTTTTDTVNGAFTAGVGATSNPTVVTTGTATFSVGQFIQISGAADPANNGLFEVLSHVGTTLTIRGVGVTATVEDFTQNQFVTDSTAQGTIVHVNVAVLRAGTDGNWEYAKGNTTGLSFTDLGAGASTTLNDAYQNGNTITTSAGDGDVIIAGTEKVQITATGGLDIDTQFDFDGTVFDVLVTGTNGFSIDGTAASNIGVAGGNLDIATTTSGIIAVDGVGGVELNSSGGALQIGNDADAQAINIGTGAAARTISMGNATGATALDLDAGTGGVTIDTTDGGAVSIDATGAPSNFSLASTAPADDLTIALTGATDSSLVLSSTGTGADALQVTASAGGIEIDGSSKVEINSGSGPINIGNDADTGAIGIGTGAAARTISIGNQTGATALDLDAGTGGVTIDTQDGGAVSIDAIGAPSNFSLASTAPADDLTIALTGATDSSLVLSSTGTGGDALQITASAGGIDINTITADTAALTISDGSNEYLNVDSTAATPTLDLGQFVNLVKGMGVKLTTDDVLVEGDIVRIKATTGNVGLADANTTSQVDALGIGVSIGSFSATSTAKVSTVHGVLVPVRFTAAPAAADNGKLVWLSTTAGQATLTMPSTSNDVQIILGILQGGDGADTTPEILWMPQPVSRGANVT